MQEKEDEDEESSETTGVDSFDTFYSAWYYRWKSIKSQCRNSDWPGMDDTGKGPGQPDGCQVGNYSI